MSSRTFLLNKVVRDGIPSYMKERKQTPKYRFLDDEQVKSELKAKMLEEVSEFDPESAAPLKELADILEVLEWAAKELGGSFDEIRQLQLVRRKQMGGFDKRTYIDTVSVMDGDEWGDYYAAEPERFPEVKGLEK
jgi:predicted house-cleaning noncanonical NTP pyrophosphatase (MazG superfamily)